MCETARDILVSVQSTFEFELSELNIDEDEQLLDKYCIDIPVVTIDGELFARYEIDPKKLDEKLKILTKEKLK